METIEINQQVEKAQLESKRKEALNLLESLRNSAVQPISEEKN